MDTVVFCMIMFH